MSFFFGHNANWVQKTLKNELKKNIINSYLILKIWNVLIKDLFICYIIKRIYEKLIYFIEIYYILYVFMIFCGFV